MSQAGELAKKYYLEEGYNCSEAVWLALNQDLDEEKLNFGLRLAGAFGGGLSSGCLCGGLGGAALSLARWFGREMGQDRHPQFPEILQSLTAFSKEKFSGTDCCDLKPEGDHK
ncbi:MAG: C-GCAxxG-C-C family (seleno)protein, partial [Halanaerobium sp.]|nr:C-GCAxxG-C-C family (seleno)protein [Halanaerobium sp.]